MWLLLEHGADPGRKTIDGQTALELAGKLKWIKDREEILELLRGVMEANRHELTEESG